RSRSAHRSRSRSRSRDREPRNYQNINSDQQKQPQQPPSDNKYLEFLPRARANFIGDIPNLRPEDAYRLDRRPDVNNRAFASMYAQHVPRYLPQDVIDLTGERHKERKKSAKPKKVKRYFISKKKSTSKSSVAPESNETSRFFIVARELLPAEQDYIPVPADWNQAQQQNS